MHPLAPDLSGISDDELHKKRAELHNRMTFAYRMGQGDIMWYWINACRALNLDPNDVIAENVRKLESRYPGGSFDTHYSENRKDGDL